MNEEFNEIANDIINNDIYLDLKNYRHHGINRYEHCLRVARWTYKATKKLKMRYKESTRAALLHDFFLVNNQAIPFFTRIKVLFTHPKLAIELSKKHFGINKFEEKLIRSHMFPVGLNIPTSLEGWLLDIIDDIASTYERIYSIFKRR